MMTMQHKSDNFVFFGTPQIAVIVLDELEKAGHLPSLIVTNPDKPVGRHHELTPSPVKVWARERGIESFEPASLRNEEAYAKLSAEQHDLFIVAAYGKIIPENILALPKHGTLNVHPSLLPKLRGASPIRSAILGDVKETGVTIMEMDAELDHGPIVAQKNVPISEWPPHGRKLDELLAQEGGALLASVIPDWLEGTREATPQAHNEATFCTKITKEMGELNLADDPYQNLLKIRAFDGWPGTFFFAEKNGARVRVKIVDAKLDADGSLKITRVIPEGKNEMSYKDFVR